MPPVMTSWILQVRVQCCTALGNGEILHGLGDGDFMVVIRGVDIGLMLYEMRYGSEGKL